jgi:hypothetical protein
MPEHVSGEALTGPTPHPLLDALRDAIPVKRKTVTGEPERIGVLGRCAGNIGR